MFIVKTAVLSTDLKKTVNFHLQNEEREQSERREIKENTVQGKLEGKYIQIGGKYR